MKERIVETVMKPHIPLYMLLFALLLCLGCRSAEKQGEDTMIFEKVTKQPKVRTMPRQVLDEEQQIRQLASEVLRAFKNKELQAVAEHVHPKIGLRFSPYTYVDSTQDRTIQAERLLEASRDSTRLFWGYYDGSGDPIRLTLSEYLSKFVYDADFVNAKQIGYQRSIGQGNMKNNSFDIYRDARIIEFHFPGFEERYDGMDWKSLRLAFKKIDNRWYLIGIIHDQWTS